MTTSAMVERAMNATFHGRTMFDVLNEATDYGWELLEAAFSAAQQWQPIETAPKDGTEILGFTRYGKRPDEFEIYVVWWDGGWEAHGCSTAFAAPSHWMPLPAPPGATA
jgi:hypothetical protein